MTFEIIGGPLLSNDVISPSKHQLEKINAPPIFTPIKYLLPYMQDWTLKVRVLSKTDLRTFTNSRRLVHVFIFDIIDIMGSEIHITFFNMQETQFHSSIIISKLYTITKGLIKSAKKQFNYSKNDCEINLSSNSTIETCLHDEHSIANHNFIFNHICISPLVTIMRKNGMETHKITL